VFTPEFRNRLDGTVFFEALPPVVIKQVATKFLDQLDTQLMEKNVSLEVSDAAKDWFAERGYDKAMGARPMARLIANTLKAPLANEILFGKLVNGGTAFVDVKDGEIVLSYESAPAPEGDAPATPPSRPRKPKEKAKA
jgi:ATP-dependent Clp protease ATP-binding subunit ClpA